jgi:hypothetical protein
MSAINSLNNDVNNKTNENDKIRYEINNVKLSPKLSSTNLLQNINELSQNNSIRANNDSKVNSLNINTNRKLSRSYSNESHSSINSSRSSASMIRKTNNNRSNSRSSVSSKSNSNIKKPKSPNHYHHHHHQSKPSSKTSRSSPHYHHKESNHSYDRSTSPSNKYNYDSDIQHFSDDKKNSSQRRSRSLERHSDREYSNYYFNTNYQESSDDIERERYAGEYTSICLKNLNEKINIDELKQSIYDLFVNYRKFSVKIVNNKKSSTSIERIAFVNFSNHSDAKSAKRSKMNKSFYGYPLYIEPVFHSYINRKSPSPLHHHHKEVDRYYFKTSPTSNKHNHHHTRSPPPSHNYQSYSSYYNQFNNSILRQRSRSQSPLLAPPPPPLPTTPPPHSITKHRSNSASPRKPNSRSITPTQNLKRVKNSSTSPKNKYNYKKSSHNIRTPSPSRINPLILSPRNNNKRRRSRSKSIDNNNLMSTSTKQTKYNISPSSYYYYQRIKEPIYSSSTYNHLKYTSESPSPPPPPKYTKQRHSRSRSKSKRNSPIPPHHFSSPSSKNYYENSRSDHRHYDMNDLSYKLNNQSSKHYFHHPHPHSPSPPSLPQSSHHHYQHHHHSSEYDRHHQYDYKSHQQSLHQGGVTHYFDNDEKDATRTLFIGNLDNDIDRSYLERIFERYGRIDDIEIKRNQSVQPPYMYHHGSSSSTSTSSVKKTYAFIKYEFMDMAISAKKHLNNKLIGKNEIKIGFGNYIIKLFLYTYILSLYLLYLIKKHFNLVCLTYCIYYNNHHDNLIILYAYLLIYLIYYNLIRTSFALL